VEIPRFEFMHWAKRALEPAPFPLGGSGTRSPAPGDVALPTDAAFPAFSSVGDEGGFPKLRLAIAEAHGTDPDHVLVSDGASLANFTAIRALSRPGRTVLVETPAYGALTTLPTLHGARVLPLPRHPDDGWLPRLDDVRAAAEAGDLDLVALSRLHNPSGADLPATFLDGLGALAEEHDFHVLLDEVYLAFVDGTPGFRCSPRFVSTGSLTKVPSAR
jgi:aspartate/methionine/tyrosine aminotransferase